MSFLRKAGLLLGILSILSGCAAESEPYSMDDISKGRELYCTCESEDEARKIADLYEIELVDYNHRIAVFHTEKNPREVIQYGKDHDLPILSLNRTSKKLN